MLTFYSKRPKQKKKAQCFLLNTLFLILLTGMFHAKSGIAQTLGINTTGAIPDSSAMLDILSPNRGLLIPRVSLTSTTDTTTIANPAISLLVYNTNAAITGGSGLGYYYYNGTLWMNFLSGTGNSLTTPLIIGGSGTTSSLTYKPTTGVGTTGADHIFKVGNNGGTEAMRILNSGILQMANNKYISLPNYTQLDFKNSSGTQGYGQIFVDNATGTYAGANGMAFFLNGATRLAILSGGNVGIGTTTPGFPLSFANVTGNKIALAGSASADFYGFGVQSGLLQIFTNGSFSDIAFGYGTSPSLTETMRIKGTGNVGVGTITPDLYSLGANHKTLTVSATAVAGSYGVVTAAGGSTGGGEIDFGNQTIRHGAVASLNGSSLAFYTNSANSGTSIAEKMRILANGNVGIGTTAPTAKTQISGDFDASTINANALVIDAKLRTSTTNGLDKAGILVTPDFNTTNSNVANTYGIKIAPIQTGVYTTTNGYGLHVTAPTVTSGFLTNSYAASFNGGNVGIGTTAPPVMLTVLNSNSVKAAIAQSLTDVTTAPTTIATANYLQLGRQEFGTNSYRLIQFGYNSAATTNSPAYMGFQETAQTGVTKGDLVFGTRDVTTNTQASERMRILANGNVGIGTTTPNSTLQVNGALSLPLVTPSIYNYSVTATDYTINVTIINSLITLPSAVGITGRIYFIKANGYTTTILTTSSQTIDGAAPPSIANGTGLMVQSDGSNWIKIN